MQVAENKHMGLNNIHVCLSFSKSSYQALDIRGWKEKGLRHYGTPTIKMQKQQSKGKKNESVETDDFSHM